MYYIKVIQSQMQVPRLKNVAIHYFSIHGYGANHMRRQQPWLQPSKVKTETTGRRPLGFETAFWRTPPCFSLQWQRRVNASNLAKVIAASL